MNLQINVLHFKTVDLWDTLNYECANVPEVGRRLVASKDIEYGYRDVSVLG